MRWDTVSPLLFPWALCSLVFDQKPPNNSESLRQRTFVRWVVGGGLSYSVYTHAHYDENTITKRPKFLWQLENIFDNIIPASHFQSIMLDAKKMLKKQQWVGRILLTAKLWHGMSLLVFLRTMLQKLSKCELKVHNSRIYLPLNFAWNQFWHFTISEPLNFEFW